MGDMSSKEQMVSEKDALPGRAAEIQVSDKHAANGHRTKAPFPDDTELAIFGMGCFWGAERRFWQQAGVYSTQVGYSGGFTPNPTYEETCTGRTAHVEVVRVIYHPQQLPYEQLLKLFWESHDPTQGMGQGNDRGTVYRSAIYFYSEQQRLLAEKSMAAYNKALAAKGLGAITTELAPAGPFYYAEEYHQQYLHKNPGGYCSMRGTGVACS